MKKALIVAGGAIGVLIAGALTVGAPTKIPVDAPKNCCYYQKARARGGVEWQTFEAKKALENI